MLNLSELKIKHQRDARLIFKFLMVPILTALVLIIVYAGVKVSLPENLEVESKILSIYILLSFFMALNIIFLTPYMLAFLVYWTILKKFFNDPKRLLWLFPIFFAALSWFPSMLLPHINNNLTNDFGRTAASLIVLTFFCGLFWVIIIRIGMLLVSSFKLFK